MARSSVGIHECMHVYQEDVNSIWISRREEVEVSRQSQHLEYLDTSCWHKGTLYII